MDNTNEIFSLSMENADLHFIIHYESFLQLNNANWKAPHSHLYYEILYSLSGNNKLLMKDSEILLENNSFTIVPPYLSHNAVYEHPSDLLSIGFYFEKRSIKYARNDLFSLLEMLLSEKYNIGILNEGLRELFLQLQGFYRISDPIHDGMLITVLVRILYNILSILMVDHGKDEQKQNSGASAESRKPYSPHGISFEILYKINEVLNARYTEDITPQMLSEQFFISPKQINRYIFKQYGKTFLQRRTELRMIAAQRLLNQTTDPIASISQKVGYNSINSFYSAFKIFCGVTPDQYRRMRQANGQVQN